MSDMDEKWKNLERYAYFMAGDTEGCMDCPPEIRDGITGKNRLVTGTYWILETLRSLGLEPDDVAEHIRRNEHYSNFSFHRKLGFGVCMSPKRFLQFVRELL